MPWGQAVTRSGFAKVPAVCSAPHACIEARRHAGRMEDDVKPTMRRLPNVLLLIVVFAFLAACSTSPYQGAPRVLYFYDSFYGEDDPFVLDALFENGFLVHKTHDVDELQASMRSRDFDLTIILVQETGPAALELDTERLEQDWEAAGRPGNRDLYVREGLERQQLATRRKLLLGVYVVPILLVTAIVYLTNYT